MIILAGACLVVAGVTIVAIFKSKKPLKYLLAEAKYEMLYNVVGSKYLMQDFVMRRKNKTGNIHDSSQDLSDIPTKFEVFEDDDLPLNSGKVAVITGGTRGIGLEVIRLLLKCDITVIIGCRNVAQGGTLLQKFRDEGISTGNIEVYQLDISVLDSVKNFSNEVKKKHEKINYLINNAGIMFGPYIESRDGFESQFATNYLGHFLLTHLLLPLLKKGAQEKICSRIVNVSSCAHIVGNIKFEDINSRNQYIPAEAYAQSKLAQILFTRYLDTILKKEQANVQVHAVHPGVVNTELFNGTHLKNIAPWAPYLLFKTPEQGAFPIIHATLSPLLEGKGGTYIHNCQIVEPSERSRDTELQEKLFSFSKKLLNIETFSEDA